MRKKYAISSLALMLTVLFVSACGATITLPGSGSSLTPLQVLQNSATAMKQLKSAHIELQNTSNLQALGTTSATPAATTPTANNVTVNVTASGDEALPDQEQLKLTINRGTSLTEILQGDKVYVQNAQGKWYVFDKASLQGIVGNTFSGFNVDQNTLLGVIQHAKITDHGDQQLNGQSLRHITADLDKDGLRQLLKDNPQFGGGLSQQDIGSILDKAKAFQSSVDVWIDETKFYVHRTEVKLNLDADTSSVGGTPTIAGTVPSNIATKLDSIIDLSKFDDPVTITPPTNATPSNDPTVILGSVGNNQP
ncbi:MAG: hypothetical protein NVS4B11_09260 [Ktedonobacteraceae bacterium]